MTDDGFETQYLIESYLQNNWMKPTDAENQDDQQQKEDSVTSFNKLFIGEFACFIAEQLIQNNPTESL